MASNPQTIFRRAHASNFVAISNELARDVNLGHRERGLLMWLLSYPSDWNVRLESLVTAEDGIKAVRRSVQKLEDAGYVKRVRERNAETGRLGGTVFLVYDEPLPPKERSRDKRRKDSPMSTNGDMAPMSQNETQAIKGSRKRKTPMSQNPSGGFGHATKTEKETKTKTTTKTPPVVVVEKPSPEKTQVEGAPERPNVYGMYERQFGMTLSPGIADTLKDMAAEYGEEWVNDALAITATSGKRGNLRYTAGILRKWQTDGRAEDASNTSAVVDEKTAWRAIQKARQNVLYDEALDMLLPAFKDEEDRRLYIVDYLKLAYVPREMEEQTS